MTNAEVILILGVASLSIGSFLLGLAVAQLPRGRRKGRHAKGKGRHAK
jgi:hypothetical protein